jgi:hypothetical protein
MDLKKITKQSLYDFVEKQALNQKVEVQNEINSRIDAVLNPILDNWVRLNQIELAAVNLAEKLVDVAEDNKSVDEWRFKRFASQLNNWSDIERQTKNEIRSRAERLIADPQQGKVSFDNKEFESAVCALQKELAPLYQKITDLAKLKNEVNNVIATETNGQRGYKALVALGVDMSDFDAAIPNLPAIVKLSVDPCLLTGGCN